MTPTTIGQKRALGKRVEALHIVSTVSRTIHTRRDALKDLIGAKTNIQLRGLSPLLKSWTGVVMDYCRSDSFEDAPWWYNERASISTLAGAAWRLKGWQALEEFSTIKRGTPPGSHVNRIREKRGRCDLYVAHGTTSFALEAKQAWQSIRTGIGNVQSAMAQARADAGNLTADQGDHRVGIVFTAPNLSIASVTKATKDREIVDHKAVREHVCKWLKNASLEQFDAYAFVFPNRCGQLVSKKTQNIYPGVLLTMSRCKTGTRTARK